MLLPGRLILFFRIAARINLLTNCWLMVYWFAELILNMLLAWLVGYWLLVFRLLSFIGVNWLVGIVVLWG